MTDHIKEIWALYEQEMASRKIEDYEVNREQMDKLIAAYRFFDSVVSECGGSVDPFRIVPTEVNGGITAFFTVFYIAGDQIEQFCNVIRSATALSIDSLEDGTVCVSFTIPGVFKHK